MHWAWAFWTVAPASPAFAFEKSDLNILHSGTSPLRDRSLTGILTMQTHMHQDLEMKVREEEQAGATPVALLRQRAWIIFDQLAFAGGPAVH